jgi:uncharacterized iron-regulated membrane protein
MTLRKLLLQIHLWLGLAAAIFLVVLGLTGSIMAFEGDIDHWLHPARWYVTPQARALPEADLIRAVEQKYAPARVGAVEISQQRNLAQQMRLNDRSAVTVNPYDGAILGRTVGPTRTQRFLGTVHQIHLRLAPDTKLGPAGKVVISYAGLVLAILAPTGFILWWRARRTSIQWKKASWFRRCFDAHNVIGLYAGLFLWTAAFTGVLIGFDSGEKAIYAMTNSSRPAFARPPQSTPVPGAAPIGIDRAIEIARQSIPGAAVDTLSLPLGPKASYTVVLRVPEETSGSAHSSLTVDQYTGKVLQVHNFLTDSKGYRWIRFNRAIHTGDLWGLFGHILTSLSSLLLVAMVITGLVIWWKKLAV